MKEYFGYEGKNCVVTGASSGMGKAVLTQLLKNCQRGSTVSLVLLVYPVPRQVTGLHLQ